MLAMKEQDLRFLKSISAEYYTKQGSLVYVPPPVNRREIGYTTGYGKFMVRHKSFDSIEKIRKLLIDFLPWDVYHSCSVYEFPEKPMGEKGELWTDLAFDIDPVHVGGSDNRSRYWVCDACGKYGRGKVEKCVYCGTNVTDVEFIDFHDLSVVGMEAAKLMRILTDDLGMNHGDIKTYFSGNKGFHVYVDSTVVRELDQYGRKEIVDYLALDGFREELFVIKSSGRWHILREGVGGRIIEKAMKIIEQPEHYPEAIPSSALNKIIKMRDKIRTELSNGSLDLIYLILGSKTFKKFLKAAIERSKVKVDSAVTLDTHRLFRMPGTLNKKGHLPKFPVDHEMLGRNVLDHLPEYGLYEVNIYIKIAPEIHMNRMKFGPFEEEEEKLPAYLAAYLITKGVGTLV